MSGSKKSARVRSALDPQRIGALYVLVALIVIFSIWLGGLFFSGETVRSVLNNNALIGILALSVLIPLSANEFDLSIGYMMGAAAILFGWLLGQPGMPIGVDVLITLAAGLVVGLFNGLIVVKLGINSFIATLATGSLLQAAIQLISKGLDLITGIQRSAPIALSTALSFTLPVFYMIVLAIGVWVLLEHTPTGRRLYAIGLGREAAVLAGVRSDKLRIGALVVSAMGASVAGIVAVAQIGSASTEIGPGYLIPAYAAAFLGSTQLKPGRFNAWGTILAVIMLGVLNLGLAYGGVALWVPYVSTGVVLILALALGQIRERTELRSRRRKWLADREKPGVGGDQGASGPTAGAPAPIAP